MTHAHTSLYRSVIVVLVMGCLLFSLATPLFAQTTNTANTTSLQAQIELLTTLLRNLQAQLAVLKGQVNASTNPAASNLLFSYTNIDDGKDGEVEITLSTPSPKTDESFSKRVPNDPIVISWEAENVPENTNVLIELEALDTDGPIGGGTWQSYTPKGDSKGTYRWDIYGVGRASAGDYKVRVGLEECHPDGCNLNAHFPGKEKNVALYDYSNWAVIEIVGESPAAQPTHEAQVTQVSKTNTPNPVVTGSAIAGVSSVGFSIAADSGDKVYGSGSIAVTNNTWSHKIADDLEPGSYKIILYVNNVEANTKTFNVTK